jgi:hypothetical protein
MTLKDKALELFVGLCLLIVVACDAGNSKKEEKTESGFAQEGNNKKKDKDAPTEGFTVIKTYELFKLSKMEKGAVTESSGLEQTADGNYWTHGDGGNEAELYKISPDGELLQKVIITGAKNKDWEDLTRGENGFLYIGDFGNNENTRDSLEILKIDEKNNRNVGTIRFAYKDQKDFPPAPEKMNFDCEGFFYHNNAFYLFTKNRGTDRWVKLYKVLDQPGAQQKVAPIDSLHINTEITAADISPDGKRIALLGDGWVYLFEAASPEQVFKGTKQQIKLEKTGQAEGLIFTSNTDMLISNEAGKLFQLKAK